MTKLELNNAMQQYLYGTTGINLLSFIVEDSCFAVFGDEEAGKTSLLEMIAGNLSVYRGTIKYNEKEAVGNPGAEFAIVYARQRGGVFLNRSVRYNLEFPLKLRGLSEMEISKAVHFAMTESGITVDPKTRAKKLSKEECARLKLARCFLRKAEFILVDDIICDLTEQQREKLLNEVYPKIAALPGVKLFAFRQYAQLSFCKVGVLLAYGITEQIGDVSDFYQNPQTLNSFMYTHQGVEAEEATFCSADHSIRLQNKKILLESEKISDKMTDIVLVAQALDGVTKIFSYPDEKLVYFD